MDSIVVYTAKESNRLLYVLEWLFTEQMQLSYRLVHDEAELDNLPFFLSYKHIFPNAIAIPDSGLLWQTGIKNHDVNMGSWNNIPVLYETSNMGYSIPFDIFSGIFFLLSRYEEYNYLKSDKHGRYPAERSVLFLNKCLQRPIIDEWINAFSKFLEQHTNIKIHQRKFTYQPTYDIDIAWSYLNKGITRSKGASLRDILKGNMSVYKERNEVLQGKAKDPYDSYEFIYEQHKGSSNKPLFFILAALSTTDYDKNISPDDPSMQALIKDIMQCGTIGLHPSYYSDKIGVLNEEKEMMEKITGHDVHVSRQHYIRFSLPQTYRSLMQHHITDDYSMGYGSHLGFRAGTGNSFFWYDIEVERQRDLRVHPFCFMDTTALYEEELDAEQAFATLNAMKEKLQQTGSTLTTVFHNFSLGTAAEWNGWSENYAAFLKGVL